MVYLLIGENTCEEEGGGGEVVLTATEDIFPAAELLRTISREQSEGNRPLLFKGLRVEHWHGSVRRLAQSVRLQFEPEQVRRHPHDPFIRPSVFVVSAWGPSGHRTIGAATNEPAAVAIAESHAKNHPFGEVDAMHRYELFRWVDGEANVRPVMVASWEPTWHETV